jgi:hypothetical protein
LKNEAEKALLSVTKVKLHDLGSPKALSEAEAEET